jgi:hypothetical protein
MDEAGVVDGISVIVGAGDKGRVGEGGVGIDGGNLAVWEVDRTGDVNFIRLGESTDRL